MSNKEQRIKELESAIEELRGNFETKMQEILMQNLKLKEELHNTRTFNAKLLTDKRELIVKVEALEMQVDDLEDEIEELKQDLTDTEIEAEALYEELNEGKGNGKED